MKNKNKTKKLQEKKTQAYQYLWKNSVAGMLFSGKFYMIFLQNNRINQLLYTPTCTYTHSHIPLSKPRGIRDLDAFEHPTKCLSKSLGM